MSNTNTNNCLTIQNRVEYYCSLNNTKDVYTLQELLETPKNMHQENVQSIHLLLRNPSSGGCLRDRPAFFRLMQIIGQLPNLLTISISTLQTKKIPASAVAILLQHAKNLQRLHMEDITLLESPYQLAEILQAHPTLHTVSLRRCSCSPVHVLLQALGRMSNLHSLTLDGSILAQQQDADAMTALAGICNSSKSKNTTSLQSLHLTDIEENSMTQQLIAMIDALHDQQQTSAKRNNLKELSLNLAVHESMPLIVVRALGRMLLSNTSLQTLVVPWTGGGELWLPVIEALAFNSTLQQLRLHPDSLPTTTTTTSFGGGSFSSHGRRGKNMDSSCGGGYCSCLSHHFLQRTATILRENNTTLSYLWYDDWESIDLEIDLYLRSNRLGRQHLIYGDNDYNNNNNNLSGCVHHHHHQNSNHHNNYHGSATHEEWVQALVSSRNHTHVSYYWLSQNPSLVVSKSA